MRGQSLRVAVPRSAGDLVSTGSPEAVARVKLSLASSTVHRPESIAASELRFVALIAATLSVITSLPYAVGTLTRIPGKTFSGVLVHSLDFNNYFAYANQAAHGQWLFRNPMTPEPHRPVFFNLEWLLLGNMSAVLHVSIPGALDLLRVLCLCFMCFGVYWLTTYVLHGAFLRKAALVAIMTGGGFGWIASLRLAHIPVNSSYFLDLTNGNFFPYFWALKIPHFLISECLIIVGLCFFLRGEHRLRAGDSIAAGVCYTLAGACRPYDMLFVMAATSVYLLWSWISGREQLRALRIRVLPVFICVPLLGYYAYIFKFHPIFKWWSVPKNPPPAFWLFTLGYGLSGLLLIAAFSKLRWRQMNGAQLFMLICLASALVLTYANSIFHCSYQFATNIAVPMILIGFVGMQEIIERARPGKMRTAVLAFLALNSLTSLALTAHAMATARKGDFHVDSALLDAYKWVDSHSQPNDVVLADFDVASNIPQFTKNVVFCGYISAVDFDGKLKALNAFLAPGTTNDFRSILLAKNDIRFVLLSNEEDLSIHLEDAAFVREIFWNKAAVVFLVRPAASMALK